jgi:hypothetical protein
LPALLLRLLTPLFKQLTLLLELLTLLLELLTLLLELLLAVLLMLMVAEEMVPFCWTCFSTCSLGLGWTLESAAAATFPRPCCCCGPCWRPYPPRIP